MLKATLKAWKDLDLSIYTLSYLIIIYLFKNNFSSLDNYVQKFEKKSFLQKHVFLL